MGQDLSQTVSAVTDVPIPKLFDFLRSPANHVRLDGSGQLVSADTGRIDRVGDTFTVQMNHPDRGEYVVENHVTDYLADVVIAWRPSRPGHEPVGVRWEWAFDVGPHSETVITHTCDWSGVTDERYLTANPHPRVSAEEMRLSVRRLIELVSSNLRLA